MNENERGNVVARAVWFWLQGQKTIEFVQWVIDPASDKFDPLKLAKQEERTQLLADLESTILNAIPNTQWPQG